MSLLDRLHKKSAEDEAIAAYNLGLKAKYDGDWHESLRQNQRADKLRPGDEATLWNLAIAATALWEWDEARRAWKLCGVEIDDGPGEVLMPPITGCVRLNPKGAGEVVWGTRIDPARILVSNVPLPESDRRCGDIILHDGAVEGQRTWNGNDYPVFNELSVWWTSEYSTFEVDLIVPNETAFESLVERCRTMKFGIEDWGKLRYLCADCSRGTPTEHVCDVETTNVRRWGIAATSEIALKRLLADWIEVEDGARVAGVELKLSGVSR
jgi:hypothetical protein